MDLDLILTNSKIEILKELAKGPKSPLELSMHFKTSIANLSQQLKLLEAYGIVSKTKLQNSVKGKPRMQYFISNDLMFLTKISKNSVVKQQIKKEPISCFMLNIIAIISKKDQFFLSKIFFDYFDVLSTSSIGYFKSTDKTIELFLITKEIEVAREKISNVDYQMPDGQTKKIIIWSHNKHEIDEGIKQKDNHFLNLINESTMLLDETELLGKYKSQLMNINKNLDKRE